MQLIIIDLVTRVRMYALGDTYRLKLEKSASARQREAIVGRVEASCFAGWREVWTSIDAEIL